MAAEPQPAPAFLFRKLLIRYALIDGLPHFYLPDLCAALNRTPDDGRGAVDDIKFPQFARSSYMDPAAGEVTVLSPIGVWFLTEMVDRFGGASLAACIRKEARRICPEPTPGDPHAFLTMLPDSCLPPRPAKFSGRLSEWMELQYSPAGLNAIGRWPAHYAPVYAEYRDAELALQAAETASMDSLVAARNAEASAATAIERRA